MFRRKKQTTIVCVLYLIALLPFAGAETTEIFDTYPQWELPKTAKMRLGKGDTNAIQFSPDGTQIAVGTSIGVWLYDVKTGKEISLFAGMCKSLAFSPDGRFLVNGGSDSFSSLGGSRWEKKIELWEIATGQKVTFPDMPPAAAVLKFSQDGKTLISLPKSRDTINRLNIETGKQTVGKLGERPGYRHLETYALTDDKIAIGMPNGNITLWDTRTGKKLSTIREHPEKLPVPNEMIGLIDDANSVETLAFSPDGIQLASGNRDTTVELWDTALNHAPVTLQKHTGWPTVLAFSPNGKLIASGSDDKTVQLWDTTTSKSLATFTDHLSDIIALAFSPDSTTLATASSDGTIRFWDTETKRPLPTRITGHITFLKAATFLKNSTTIASVGYNGIITIWDLKTSEKATLQTKRTLEITTFREWYVDLKLSPDGTRFVSPGTESSSPYPSRSDRVLRLTEVSTGRELMSIPGSASNLTFSPDGKTVAGKHSGAVRLWNTATGRIFDVPLSDPDNDPDGRNRPLIRTLEFAPDGRKFASGTMGGDVQMWDTETGTPLTSFFGEDPPIGNRYRDPIMDLAFSSDGSLLAVGSRKALRLLGNSKQLGLKELSYDPERWGETLLFSPDDTVLVIGFSQDDIELWDLTTGEKLAKLEGHTNSIQTLVFSPDGKTLMSAGGDGTVLLWDWNEVLTTARTPEPAEESLNTEPRSETVLRFVERTAENEANARYISTVKQNYREQKWNRAFAEFKNDLETTTFGSSQRKLIAQIYEMGKNAEDKERYLDMLNKLMTAMPDKTSVQLNIHLLLAAFYRDNNMPEKAAAHTQKTGFMTEDAWLVLAPFDNTHAMGYDTAYIPEDRTQVDTTEIYDGMDYQIKWAKSTDNTFNGYISLGDNVDWGVAYAFAIVTSPDEREVQFRFDSDDQAKIWLNGEEIFRHTKAFSAEIDRYTIPAMLKPGNNSILVKVCEEDGGWGFYLRITDTDGEPFRDLKISRSEEIRSKQSRQ